MTQGSWFTQGMNIHETSIRLPKAGGWRRDTKRSEPSRIFQEQHQMDVLGPSACSQFLPTKVLFKPSQFLLLTLHAVGGV